MNKPFHTNAGEDITRMEVSVFNLEDEEDMKKFLKGDIRTVKVPFSDKTITYDFYAITTEPESEILKQIVGVTRLGTENAISLGAYYYAVNRLNLE